MYVPLLVNVLDSSCFMLIMVTQSLDIFHVFINTRRSRLLENASTIKPRTEDDWEAGDVSETSSSLLSPVTPQQRALPVVLYEMSRICTC